MKITEHEMRGLLAGKCLPADILVGENLAAYLVRKFTAMQQKLDALAAENEQARKAVQTFCDVVGPNTYAICEEVGIEGVTVILAAMHATGNMPDTDTYLNSVRAEGVDMFAAHLRTDKTDVSVCKLFALGADDFAAKLRAGEPS